MVLFLRVVVVNIESLPEGLPIETPLHAKRSRTLTLSPLQLNIKAPLPVDPTVAEGTPHEDKSLPVMVPPSPEMNGSGEQGMSSPSGSGASVQPPRPLQLLQNEESFYNIDYGSEESEVSEEEDLLTTLIPRTIRFLMNMDMSRDDNVAATTMLPTTMPDLSTSATVAISPHSFYDFEWKSFPNPPIPLESRRETFSKSNVGPTTPCADPYDTFIAIWDRQIMKHIASETNRYAQDVIQKMIPHNTVRTRSRLHSWHPTTVDELYVYFGITLAMGVLVKNNIAEYWSATPDIFCTPGFSVHMSSRRFRLLSKFLHFNNNKGMSSLKPDTSEAKLFKMKPLLSHLNSKFCSMYNMSQNIVLDKSLLQRKGRLDINQFIPNKVTSAGIKTYEICESQTGYMWRFEIHAYEAFKQTIVLRLIQGLEYKGHTLWMHNFYNSPILARRLKSFGIDCVGPLKTNCQFVPKTLTGLTKANVQPGDITGFTSGDVDLMVWRDQNLVATISTYHGNAMTHDNGHLKPILITDYKVMMDGVDKKDQMLAMYPIERKRTRVWCRKLFCRLLNVSVLNSYILVKQSSSSILHRSFRLSLIKSLLKNHASVSVSIVAPPQSRLEIKYHHLADLPYLPGQTRRQRRTCSICKKRVHTFCVGCNKAVCMTCFVPLHPE
ncbi:unnamed protein product [Parnassius mnemosyne]|uniref:B box-type domain-containing protein n=1 Tax=Parnassius mnemosyne TaxID=213953 RepID=A0AAV1M2P9_9NEOP